MICVLFRRRDEPSLSEHNMKLQNVLARIVELYIFKIAKEHPIVVLERVLHQSETATCQPWVDQPCGFIGGRVS